MNVMEALYCSTVNCPAKSFAVRKQYIMQNNEQTIYKMVGGDATFKRLVADFYVRVEADEALRAIFPDDLEPGKRYQELFLIQFFGGPPMYGEERGHPRLRMRHMPYAIDNDAMERWLGHMLAAIDAVGIEEPARSAMRQYFERAAPHMMNVYTPQGD